MQTVSRPGPKATNAPYFSDLITNEQGTIDDKTIGYPVMKLIADDSFEQLFSIIFTQLEDINKKLNDKAR
jgi:hypothetical protein